MKQDMLTQANTIAEVPDLSIFITEKLTIKKKPNAHND